MRIIKFRVWDGDRMIYDVQNLYESELWSRFHSHTLGSVFHDKIGDFPAWKTMQFTGLIDKNGKEIYEGDLLVWLEKVSEYYYSKFTPKVKAEWIIVSEWKKRDGPVGWQSAHGYKKKFKPFEVVYNEKDAAFTLGDLRTNKDGYSGGRRLSFRSKSWIVVGNIYENKLCEVKK